MLNREPPEPGNPLLGLPNVILCPHIAGTDTQSMREMAELAATDHRRALPEPLAGGLRRQFGIARELAVVSSPRPVGGADHGSEQRPADWIRPGTSCRSRSS